MPPNGSPWSKNQLVLPAEVGAPRTARAAAGDWLQGLPRSARSQVLLVVSELVTNAVKYGKPPITLVCGVDERKGVDAVSWSVRIARRPAA